MSILNDLRYGIRTLGRARGLTFAALLTLALGIGATAAMFSFINAVLLRPLPYRDPDRLVAIWQTSPQTSATRRLTSYANFLAWRDQSQSFEAMTGSMIGSIVLEQPEPGQISICPIAPGFFELLGVKPARGRLFVKGEEHVPAGGGVPVILSWATWERRFGLDPNIIGRTLMAKDAGTSEIVGVMPKWFRQPGLAEGETPPDVWFPFDYEKYQAGMNVIARLKPGVTFERARTEMAGIGQRLSRQIAENKGLQVNTAAVKDLLVRPVRRALWLLLAATAVLLLCGCVNVANLLLARAVDRRREFAIRATLGGGRGRLFRQVITEGLLLGVAGGALGICLAVLGVPLLAAAAGSLVPRIETVQVDGAVLLFTLAVSCVTGLAFACVPAFGSSRMDLSEPLKAGGRTGSGTTHGRTRSFLLACELALSIVLLAGAGLLIRSFWQVLNIDLGFAPKHVLTAELGVTNYAADSAPRARALMRDFLARVEKLPGVTAAGAAQTAPLAFDAPRTYEFELVGQPGPESNRPPEAFLGIATPGYFRAMGISLRRGRLFDDRDGPEAPPVVLVNEAFVRSYCPNLDPVGMAVDVGRTRQRADKKPTNGFYGVSEIVGVIADVRQTDMLAEAPPQIWTSFAQRTWSPMAVTIRTVGDPLKLAGTLKSELRALDRTVPLDNIRTAEEIYSDALAERRLSMLLLGALAAIALLLSATGTYGVISYWVTQRRREIGIRMALGARSADVLGMVIRQGMAIAGAALLLGIPAALAASRLLASHVYGIAPHDPVTFGVVAALFVGVAAAASYLPGRAATKLEPMSALRLQ